VGRLAIIGGSGLVRSTFGTGAQRVETSPLAAAAGVLEADTHVVLQRHGIDGYVLPHMIDHFANAAALEELDCDRALALGSVGSLRADLPIGTLIDPHDFIALGASPSAFTDHRAHTIPGFDSAWRSRVRGAFEGQDEEIVEGGIYWESPGPRFETPAEIRLFAAHADVVGMTLGGECCALCERGIACAAICVVDNMANGIGPDPLTLEEFERGQTASAGRLLAALERALPELV